MIARYSGLQGSKEIYKKNSITFGVNTKALGYQTSNFYTIADVLFLKAHFLNEKNAKYFIPIIKRHLPPDGWDKIFGLEQMKDLNIRLPINNGKIDFEFMDRFVAELENEHIQKLENYLFENGLNDYQITNKEKETLENFESGKIQFQNFTFKNIFSKIEQGRRLKKDDQLPGEIPFVMAGVTNTGVVNYISNPVANFPKNSITIDIFGNTFYRNYEYGAGDDTGVYWNDKLKYSKGSLLFFTSAMEKSVSGKFDYGKKLRSSQSFDFKMQLPSKEQNPDYETMETIISAVHKLVIKNVVLYVERKKQELNKQIEKANA